MQILYTAINELVSHGNKITPITFRVVFDFLHACALVQPDWLKAPDWAQWWAVDADGQTAWFATEPQIDTVIKPALAQKQIVLCDRYADSTIAYQGFGHEMPLAELHQIINYATAGLVPDLTILLDVDSKAGLQRKQQQGEVNRFEEQAIAFHERVRTGFLTLARAEPERWLIINAADSITTIASMIQTAFLAKSHPFTVDN